VKPLATALEDASGWVGETAARALGRIGDACAVPSLIAALDDAEERVHHPAVEALGQIGDPRAVERLVTALKDERDKIRSAAAKGLGLIGDARAVEPLVAALDDAAVKGEAAQALDRLNWQPPADETGARCWIAKGEFEKCVAIGIPAVPVLIAALKETNSQVRDGASEALAQIGTPAAAPLLAAIQDEPWRLSSHAFKLLVRIGDTRATEAFINALKHPNVSWDAAKALGEIGDVAAVELLNPARTVQSAVAALGDGSRFVRRAAAKVLVELYASGRLAPEQKQLVLDQQTKIVERHTDHSDHKDVGKDCAPFDSHTDWKRHTDHGIGVDFPL
jgi:HEAT repeat protein